ncbi:hypothetical protein NEUTE2DRAFT_59169 [Neurospora tetrasperma FGSC 2509]|nr:hypothetical protein NEUTE2DRAFT_59169 [Neurospora tetrasperma FGSC 2509]
MTAIIAAPTTTRQVGETHRDRNKTRQHPSPWEPDDSVAFHLEKGNELDNVPPDTLNLDLDLEPPTTSHLVERGLETPLTIPASD